MIFSFLNILALLTIFAGVVCLVDIIWRKHKKITAPAGEKLKHSVIVDYSRSFFPILLIVLLFRTFLFQPYRVPTGSLEPTVMPGDLILVNQYDYGLRWPLWHTTFWHTGVPQRGQIALFHWPVNPAVTFVKRVIAGPGDHVSYINKVLTINGKEMKQTFVKDTLEVGAGGETHKAKEYLENLGGVKHLIYVFPDSPAQDFKDYVVPKGQYFMMGDNRDNSDDSRSWGAVPYKQFIGRALLIWLSWDSQEHRIRWNRIGNKL